MVVRRFFCAKKGETMLEVITGEDRYRVLTQKRKLAKEGAETVSGLTEEVKSLSLIHISEPTRP